MPHLKSWLDPGRLPLVNRVRDRWLSLSPLLRGALWLILAGLAASIMSLIVKLLGSHLDAFQIALFRALFGLLMLLPFVIAAGPAILKTRRPWGHLFRGIAGASGLLCTVYAVANLPLADSTAYMFTAPFFLIVLAVFFLGEKIRARRLTATAIGFTGVLVMMRPTGAIEPGALAAVLAAACYAIVIIFVKRLTQTEAAVTVLFYFCVTSTLVLLVPALFVWRQPSWTELWMLCLAGMFGSLSQSAAIRAFNAAEATAISALDYVKLLYAGAFGYFIFGEVPTGWTLAGAAIIIGSSLYITIREHDLERRSRSADAAPPSPSPAQVVAAVPEGAPASLARLPRSNH